MRSLALTAIASTIAFIPIAHSIAQPAPCSYQWESLIPGYVSVEGTVRAIVPWDPDGMGPAAEELIAAGNLDILDSPSQVARFDGTRWLRMDDGLEPDSLIDAVTIWNGVPLVSIRSANTGISVKAWTGTDWQSIGTFDNSVFSMVESNGDLFVCGIFSSVDGIAAPTVARYDGTAWHALSESSPFFIAISLTEFRGDIVVNGWSGQAGNTIRRWNGTGWPSLTPLGIDGIVIYMTVHQDRLVISGDFAGVNGTSATRVASFDGNTWSAMGVPEPAQSLSHVISLSDRLFLRNESSSFSEWDTVQEWDGTSWFSPPEFFGVGVNALATWQDQIVINGRIAIPGQSTIQGLSRWNGTAWIPLATGEPVTVSFAEAWGEELVVGGDFSNLNGDAVRNLAVWDGTGWREIGGAPDAKVTDGFIHAGQLFVFGDFSRIGNAAVSRSARWDGSTWTAFVPRNELILDVNNLYRRVGNEIHRWSGTDWAFDHNLGSRCGGTTDIFRNETYAYSSEISGPPSISWSWNRERNNECLSVFSGYNDRYNFSSGVSTLGIVDDVLVGSYSTSRSWGGFTTSSAWAWDGDKRLPTFGAGSSGGPAIPENPDTRIRAINWLHGNLVVGGHFQSFGGSAPNRFAVQWNGTQWTELGEGVNGPVLRISKWRNKLVVVGEFSTAGGFAAPGIALWSCPDGCSCDGDGDGIIDEQDACPGYNDATDSDADGVPDCLEPPPNDTGNDNSNTENSNSGVDPGGSNQNDNSADGGEAENPDASNDSDEDVAADLPALNCGACGASAPLGLFAGLVGLLVVRGSGWMRRRSSTDGD